MLIPMEISQNYKKWYLIEERKKYYKKCRILRDKMKGSIFYTNIIAATKNTRVRDQEI